MQTAHRVAGEVDQCCHSVDTEGEAPDGDDGWYFVIYLVTHGSVRCGGEVDCLDLV